MEKYMLIFHGTGHRKEMSPEQMQKLMGKWFAWVEKLKKADLYESGEPLAPGGKFISDGGKSVTDGPYTEGKEVVGGFFIVKAKDIDEAVALCKDYPGYEYDGTIQVRQVMKM
jgi:hypothetical protein